MTPPPFELTPRNSQVDSHDRSATSPTPSPFPPPSPAPPPSSLSSAASRTSPSSSRQASLLSELKTRQRHSMAVAAVAPPSPPHTQTHDVISNARPPLDVSPAPSLPLPTRLSAAPSSSEYVDISLDRYEELAEETAPNPSSRHSTTVSSFPSSHASSTLPAHVTPSSSTPSSQLATPFSSSSQFSASQPFGISSSSNDLTASAGISLPLPLPPLPSLSHFLSSFQIHMMVRCL